MTFGELSHGEAVGLGLVAAGRLSVRLGLADAGVATRIEQLATALGLATTLPRAVDFDHVVRALAYDKKRIGGDQRFVLLAAIGDAVVQVVDQLDEVRAVVESLQPTRSNEPSKSRAEM